MNDSGLCGVYQDKYGQFTGKYTAEGITTLCEGIKQCKSLVSLR